VGGGRRRVSEPSSGDLESVSSTNNESILHCSENEMSSRTKHGEKAGLLVDFREVHVRVTELGVTASRRVTSFRVSNGDNLQLQPIMPPMALTGVVTKVGYMNKTATVTVYRNILHHITGKVRADFFSKMLSLLSFLSRTADRTKDKNFDP
jgi:hypothetical protein